MTGWTDERIRLVVSLWDEGYSATQIAARLDCGISRNAVLGKVHRMNLPCHTRPRGERRANIKPKVHKPKPRQPRAPRLVKLPPPPAPPPPEPWTGPSICIVDPGLRDFMCREIVAGSGADTMFCGAPTVPGSRFSFCAFHAQKNVRLAKREARRSTFVPWRAAA